VHKDNCTLKWSKPKDDGGEPLEGYLVEKFDPDNGVWLPVGRTKDPEMQVTGLIPGHEYSFRVKAINSQGESEPLETLSTIVAKDPFSKRTSGGYNCSVRSLRNLHDGVRCFVLVNPESPGAPDINDWSQNHVDLVWQKPVSDGGTPITHYVIEKKDKYRWVKKCLTERINGIRRLGHGVL